MYVYRSRVDGVDLEIFCKVIFVFGKILAAVRSVCLLVVFFIHTISLAFETTTFLSCCWLTGCYAFSSHAFGFLFVVVLAFFWKSQTLCSGFTSLVCFVAVNSVSALKRFPFNVILLWRLPARLGRQVVSGIELSSVRPSVALRRYLSYWESVC